MKHVQPIKIGQTDTIELGIRGYPKPSFTWKKDKKPLNPSSDPHYTLLDDGSLRVNIVRIGDQGNYSYTVEQSGYEITENIEVYAVGKCPCSFMFGNVILRAVKGGYITGITNCQNISCHGLGLFFCRTQ